MFIVIVEDDPINSHLLHKMVNAIGYEAINLYSIPEAKIWIKENMSKIDVILADKNIHNKNSLELLDVISDSSVYFVLISGEPLTETEKEKLFSYNQSYSFIEKPYHLKDISSILSEIELKKH